MYTVDSTNRTFGLAVTTAMASVMLAGCAGGAAPQASVSAEKAEQAIASGKHKRAIEHAEAAVAAEPRNVEYRATLGQAYLDAGRFASAATTFQDAIDLGDSSARTKLSLALAMTAEGRLAEADALLQASEGQIATADLGLAMALAGNPNGAVHLMSNAIRGGQNTVKMRQNLAYAYALAGRWREARLMTAQDVPADLVGARMEEWAAQVHPMAYRQRLAALLDVPAGTLDNGQPLHLALSNNPSLEMLADQAVADNAPQVAAFMPVEQTVMTIESVELPPAKVATQPVVQDNRYQSVDTSAPANFAAAFKPDHAPAPAAPGPRHSQQHRGDRLCRRRDPRGVAPCHGATREVFAARLRHRLKRCSDGCVYRRASRPRPARRPDDRYRGPHGPLHPRRPHRDRDGRPHHRLAARRLGRCRDGRLRAADRSPCRAAATAVHGSGATSVP